MSKSVTIPSSDQEMWVCRINHKEYSYPQGTQQSVPDEVAELIASINAQEVKATPEEQATWEVYSQGGWIPMQGGDSLPDTTSASEGDVLSLNASKEPVWSAPSGGGSGVLIEATGEFNNVSFNDETCSGTPISGSVSDYIDAVESGKTLIIVTEGAGGTLKYGYPVVVNPVEAYNLISMAVIDGSVVSEAYIGYPEGHPNDLYYMIPTQS